MGQIYVNRRRVYAALWKNSVSLYQLHRFTGECCDESVYYTFRNRDWASQER